MTAKKLDKIWQSAREVSEKGHTRGFQVKDDSPILLLEDSSGVRHFVVRTGNRKVELDWSSDAIQVRTLELNVDGRLAEYLRVSCLESSGHALFDQFIQALDATEDPLASLSTKLEEYRAFWTAPRLDFTSEQAIGLFGELHFLNSWLEPERDLKNWTGHDRTLRDFSWDHLCIEVKATRKEVPRHRISSVNQLLSRSDRRLCLYSLLVRQDPEGGYSLLGVIEAVKNRLVKPDQPRQFVEGLANSGFRPDIPELEKYRYIILQETLYDVRDGFPRCIPSSFIGGNVPDGVSEISYSVDLSGCAQFDTGTRAPLKVSMLKP